MELESIMLKLNKSVRERQITYDLTRVEFKKQNKGAKGQKRERQTKEQTLNCREQTDGYQRGNRGRGECTCEEHQVLCGNVQSLYCTPETNITPC